MAQYEIGYNSVVQGIYARTLAVLKSREGKASERGKPMTVSQPAWPSWKILTLLSYLL